MEHLLAALRTIKRYVSSLERENVELAQRWGEAEKRADDLSADNLKLVSIIARLTKAA